MAETPFDSIESAQYYLRVLAAEVEAYRLKPLAQQLDSSYRILNDVDAAASRAIGPLLHL